MVAGPDSTLQMQPANATTPRPARRRASRPPTSTWSSSTRRSPPSASRPPASSASTEDKVNVNGGAIALGHPVGMSGARIVLHLALELKRRGGGVGAAALCGGGGQGDALIVRVPGLSVAAPALAGRRPRPRRAGPRGRRARGRPADLAGRGRLAAAARGDGRRWRRTPATPRSSASPARPGVGKSTSTTALVARAARGRTSGSACSRSTRPRRSPAARCSATGCGCRTTRSTATSTSARWPRAVTSAGCPGRTPQALRVLDAAGCDVVLVETVGVGQSEVEIAGLADTTLVLLAPGHGRRHPGGEGRDPRDRRRLRRQQGRPRRRRPGPPRPALDARAGRAARGRLEAADRQDRRAARARASTRWSTEIDQHRAWLESSRRARQRRRTRRARDEIEAIAVTALRERWGDVHERAELDDLAAAVVARASPTPTPRPTRCWRTCRRSAVRGHDFGTSGVPAWESPVDVPKVARVASHGGERLLVGRGLCFDVDGRRVLDDVSLTGEPGRMLAVTGSSGLRQDHAALAARRAARARRRRGVVRRRAGRPRSRASRCPGTGFVLQSYGLVPTLTAAENVAIALRGRGVAAVGGHRAGVRARWPGSGSTSSPTG